MTLIRRTLALVVSGALSVVTGCVVATAVTRRRDGRDASAKHRAQMREQVR